MYTHRKAKKIKDTAHIAVNNRPTKEPRKRMELENNFKAMMRNDYMMQ